MPDALELPGMLRTVVKLVRSDVAFVEEHIALALGHSIRTHQVFGFGSGRVPGFAAVIGALDDLPEPATRLRRVDAIRIRGRALEMIHLPPREVRPADLPILAFA